MLYTFVLSLFAVLVRASADLSVGTLQCSTLAVLLPGKVSFPGNSDYISSIQSYWFASERLTPTCVVSPTCALDVSVIVKALGLLHGLNPQSAFAVRGGGHSPNPGQSNIGNGVTIDMSGVDAVTLNANHSIASIGGGARWGNVYAALGKYNLAVLGGRDSGVGVGGLLTGGLIGLGGVSFLSPLKGFACDNVANYEVVLASGSIIDVNASSYPDLFRALKGGSNNFGIVTRFDLYTWPTNAIFGGAILYPPSADAAQLSAFAAWKQPENYDPYAEVEQSFLYTSANNISYSANIMSYGKPEANPSALQGFMAVQPQELSLVSVTTFFDLTELVHSFQPANDQGVFATTTIVTSEALLVKIHDLYRATIPQVAGVANLTYVLVFQSIPMNLGGNSLGLEGSTQNLTLVLLSHFWQNAADSPLMLSITQNLVNDIEKAAKAMNAFNPYKYLNYAAAFQNPLAGYGQANLNFLKTVSAKYDPRGLFQTGVPGGFKLGSA